LQLAQLVQLVQLGRRAAAQLIEAGRNRSPALHACHVTGKGKFPDPGCDPQRRGLAMLALDQQRTGPQFAFRRQILLLCFVCRWRVHFPWLVTSWFG